MTVREGGGSPSAARDALQEQGPPFPAAPVRRRYSKWKRSNRSLNPSMSSRGGAGFPPDWYLPAVEMFCGRAGSTLIHGGVGEPLSGVPSSNRWLRDASVGKP